MTGSEVRKTFLDYFAARGHRVVKSSPVVPANDPTLLFTNAGMNQFKDVFLGLDHRDYTRAASSQKCMRAGGKHNDLENVGRTRRHLTFFEMLGNFSFGDYFKKEAIEYAYDLIFGFYKIPKDRVHTTVLSGGEMPVAGGKSVPIPRDDEAAELWKAAGIPPDHVHYMDHKDNFWMMGDTGPCGPCSEMHFDFGAAASELGHADCKFPCECGRYMEFWNLVFMQFNLDSRGVLSPLPKPSIDTGMGFERIVLMLQNKLSVFETDLLFPLVEEAAEMAGTDYGVKPETDVSLRILADHSRAAAFLINDGVLPSNDGRGYVLRKVLRRAVRHGKQIGFNEPFLYKLTGKVAELMADAYPELLESTQRVAAVVKSEEQRFAHTMTIALQEFEKVIASTQEELRPKLRQLGELIGRVTADLNIPEVQSKLKPVAEQLEAMEEAFRSPELQAKLKWVGDRLEALQSTITTPESKKLAEATRGYIESLRSALPGDKLFRLYDTFGMPLDWIKEMANERGLRVDEAGFEAEMQRQRERARASWKGAAKEVASPFYSALTMGRRTTFEGYERTISHACRVIGLAEGTETKVGDTEQLRAVGLKVLSAKGMIGRDEIAAGAKAEIVLDHTPFYPEAGGQVGDTGHFLSEESQELVAVVEDTYYPVSGLIAHRVITRGPIRVGDKLTAIVDAERRESTKRNHTGTHLLHAALRKVLGTHVKQAGSVVEPGRLRFDFSHFASVDDLELQEIEKLANEEIIRNTPVETAVMEIDEALETGAMAFFGEKYPDRVRVVDVPGFSKELCGGTHVSRTGDIGLLKITHEGSISAGVRRVEAITGEGALEHYQQVTTLIRSLAGTIKTSPAELPEAVEKLVETQRNLERQVESLRMKLAQSHLADLEGRIRTVNDIKVLAIRVDALERNQMRDLADSMRQKLQSGVVVLGSAIDGKVALIAALTPDLTKRLHAGKIAQAVAKKLGGTGGGRPDLAEAGGKDPEQLDHVLNEVYDIVGAML